ncbi:hypothetical protein OVA24_15120 [Luteolibacter sp. SL250]|uniref:hypothetical protein n=1 Tax=Luteolibacter sp. SL250 TaxID=2995170 RepID=UPI00226D5B71|nr:hypothetical protein [Luteolibacter sp. SL250]WAC18564.1 hypothetical protein OVA24_15120 [Luteolibacter sp. SL250]
MSGYIQISQLPWTDIPRHLLGSFINLKNRVKDHSLEENNNKDRETGLKVFKNNYGDSGSGSPLPSLSHGTIYLEGDLGQARSTDPQGPRGRKRVVFMVRKSDHSIMAAFVSEQHHLRGGYAQVRDKG